MTSVVVDTNVPVAANGRETHAPASCRLACIDRLEQIVNSSRVAIDEAGLIFAQYRRYLNFSGQPGVGDVFFKHVFDNMFVAERVERVKLTPDADEHRQFAEFPADDNLATFDRGDVVIVAVARAGRGRRSIINATDGGWLRHRQALERHGVTVDELCLQQDADTRQ